MATDEAALLAEANRINYRLRSTFFYRKLKEYDTLGFPTMVTSLYPVEHLYDWGDRAQWRIGQRRFHAGHIIRSSGDRFRFVGAFGVRPAPRSGRLHSSRV